MTKERCEYCEVSLPAADHECNPAVLRQRIERLQSGLRYEMERNDRLEQRAVEPKVQLLEGHCPCGNIWVVACPKCGERRSALTATVPPEPPPMKSNDAR